MCGPLKNWLSGTGQSSGQSMAGNTGIGQQMLQQHLAAQQLMDQAGQVIHYNGTQTPYIQSSPYAPQGQVYMMPNGTFITNPSITADQLEELRNKYLNDKRVLFLTQPQRHREAFLDSLRAQR